MANLKLEASYRTDMAKSRVKRIRREGYVTGSVFGKGTDSMPIEVNIKDLVEQIKGSDAAMMSLIDLKIKGAPKGSDGTVIIKQFYKDPLTRKVLDIQFQRISMKDKINVSVPIVLVGDAAGVREGGIVEQLLDTLDVSCLPSDIPPRIEVDVSNLEIGHHIRIADLGLAAEIEVRMDPQSNVCTCVPPHVAHLGEAAEETTAEEAPAEATAEAQTASE